MQVRCANSEKNEVEREAEGFGTAAGCKEDGN